MMPLFPAPELIAKTGETDGVMHSWYEHVPKSYDGAKAVLLVVSLHGGTVGARDRAREHGWTVLAERGGFIAVFPNATNSKDEKGSWNAFYANTSMEYTTRISAQPSRSGIKFSPATRGGRTGRLLI